MYVYNFKVFVNFESIMSWKDIQEKDKWERAFNIHTAHIYYNNGAKELVLRMITNSGGTSTLIFFGGARQIVGGGGKGK